MAAYKILFAKQFLQIILEECMTCFSWTHNSTLSNRGKTTFTENYVTDKCIFYNSPLRYINNELPLIFSCAPSYSGVYTQEVWNSRCDALANNILPSRSILTKTSTHTTAPTLIREGIVQCTHSLKSWIHLQTILPSITQIWPTTICVLCPFYLHKVNSILYSSNNCV